MPSTLPAFDLTPRFGADPTARLVRARPTLALVDPLKALLAEPPVDAATDRARLLAIGRHLVGVVRMRHRRYADGVAAQVDLYLAWRAGATTEDQMAPLLASEVSPADAATWRRVRDRVYQHRARGRRAALGAVAWLVASGRLEAHVGERLSRLIGSPRRRANDEAPSRAPRLRPTAEVTG